MWLSGSDLNSIRLHGRRNALVVCMYGIHVVMKGKGDAQTQITAEPWADQILLALGSLQSFTVIPPGLPAPWTDKVIIDTVSKKCPTHSIIRPHLLLKQASLLPKYYLL